MVRRSEPLLLTFGIRANYEIKLSLTIFQIFHKDHCNLKVRLEMVKPIHKVIASTFWAEISWN